MCPNISKGHMMYMVTTKELYEKYVNEGKYMKKIKARDLWFQVLILKWKQEHHICCIKMHVTKK